MINNLAAVAACWLLWLILSVAVYVGSSKSSQTMVVSLDENRQNKNRHQDAERVLRQI